MGCLRGCLGAVVLVGALLLAGYAGWKWGGPLYQWAEQGMAGAAAASEGAPGTEEPSLELGRAALDRVQELQDSDEGTELRLSGAEVESIFRYSLPALIPRGFSDPGVSFDAGVLELSGGVSRDVLGDVPELVSRLGVPSDTVRVEIEATVSPHARGAVTFAVTRLRIGSFPVPRVLIPPTLDALGRERRDDLPAEAILAPLPEGIGAAWVRGDSLVLVAGG